MSRNKVVETELRELCGAARGRISAGGTDEWPDEHLAVPPLPPTNLRGCHVIRIQYDVFVRNQQYYSSIEIGSLTMGKTLSLECN